MITLRRTFFLAFILMLTTAIGITSISAQDTVDCPTDDFIDVQPDPANSAYANPELIVTCTEDMMIVESNGIPNFEFVRITPNEMQAQNHVWEIPLNPVMAEETSDIPLLGTVAFSVNGLPIYGPNEAPMNDYGDPYLDGLLDYCGGHIGGMNDYHLHTVPSCIFEDYDGSVGLVVGYSLDGYPILAPFLCTDESCTETIELTSSWERTSDVTNAWEAHEFIEGSGDLDQCNGMTMDDGSYAYFATDTFPYVLGCYVGEIEVNEQAGQGAPPNGGDGQQGNRPPPNGGNGNGNPPPPNGAGN